MEKTKNGIAIVPGSFDPITYGHINIVKRAASSYDKVYLAVMVNSQKKYMFNLEERKRIAYAAVSDIDNVEVISSDGMLWELAQSLSADAIVKGYRNETDLEYERSMAEYNKKHYPKADTVMLKSDDELTEISSTAVRQKILNGEELKNLIPQTAIEEIKKILKNKVF